MVLGLKKRGEPRKRHSCYFLITNDTQNTPFGSKRHFRGDDLVSCTPDKKLFIPETYPIQKCDNTIDWIFLRKRCEMPIPNQESSVDDLNELIRRPSILRREYRRGRVATHTTRWLDLENTTPMDLSLPLADELSRGGDVSPPNQRALRFSERNNFRIVPRSDAADLDEGGLFGSHHRHCDRDQQIVQIPTRMNRKRLARALNKLLAQRCIIQSRLRYNRFLHVKSAERGVKRKFESLGAKPFLNTYRTEELIRSMYLKPGSTFEMTDGHVNFKPVIKFSEVDTKSNKLEGTISIEGCEISLDFSGVVVDLLQDDFRIHGATTQANPLIEASIFSNLIRNAICYNKDMKNFIGRHQNVSSRAKKWKPFYLNKFGYLMSNDLSQRETVNPFNLLTPRLTQSECSESELSVWEDRLSDGTTITTNSTPSNSRLKLSGITPSAGSKQDLLPISTSTSANKPTSKHIRVKQFKNPKFPSTSLFHPGETASSSNITLKVLSSWFSLPPFNEFLKTPAPPTPPRDLQGGEYIPRSNLNPETIFVCSECLVGESMDEEKMRTKLSSDQEIELDSGLLGKFIFIKAAIDIEDILWEDVFEEDCEDVEDSKEVTRLMSKRVKFNLPKSKFKYKKEVKVKPDIVFKKRRRFAQMAQRVGELFLEPGFRRHPDWTPSTDYVSEPVYTIDRGFGSFNLADMDTSESDSDGRDFQFPRQASNLFHSVTMPDVPHNIQRPNEDLRLVFDFQNNNTDDDQNNSQEGYDSDGPDVEEERIFQELLSSSDEEISDDEGTYTVFSQLDDTEDLRHSESDDLTSELLYRCGSNNGGQKVFARSLYNNDVTQMRHNGLTRGSELHRKRPFECRRGLSYRVFKENEPPQNTKLSVSDQKGEFDHHLKLHLAIVINRTSGELQYYPMNMDANNWSVQQNDGELFNNVSTFSDLWGVLNGNADHDHLKSMMNYVSANKHKFKRLQKLLLLHGLTNGSIVNGMKNASKTISDSDTNKSNKSNLGSRTNINGDDESPDLVSEAKNDHSEFVVSMKPALNSVPFGFELV